jgi:hypothetical protein
MMRLLMERGFARWEASEKRCPRLVEWNEEEEKDIVYEALTERRCENWGAGWDSAAKSMGEI